MYDLTFRGMCFREQETILFYSVIISEIRYRCSWFCNVLFPVSVCRSHTLGEDVAVCNSAQKNDLTFYVESFPIGEFRGHFVSNQKF